ncbi:MAG: ATP-binding protein [Candidatus Eisenbacteria bacterium]|nr:ATP-binding protein [Candidatus Eisenbacteria bacterium]
MDLSATPRFSSNSSSGSSSKIVILAAIVSLTLAVHYGWLGGHTHAGHSPLLKAIHGRLCYIPIVISAIWFGLRGGITCALVISTAVIPYIVRTATPMGELSGELIEIVFYFAIGSLSGALVERERLQRKRMQVAQARLEQSQRLSMMGQMAAGVAHEIKNPLASIKGAAGILAEGLAPDSPRQEFAEIIGREVGRLNGTVQNFLDFARPQPCQFSLERLGDILASTLRQMEPQIASASLTLQSNIPSFDDRVWADPQKLRQVFINLILNAIAATPPGGKIIVELGQTTKNRERFWEIRFSDTGSGIAPDNMDRIFEPFFTQKTTGSGLGLAIVRSIIEEHKGRVEAVSDLGRGATFTILLPLPAG